MSAPAPSLPADPSLSPTTKSWGWMVIAVSILASAAMLVAQQVAIRLLAPLIGSSVETWSTIIGVFLLGIALGNRIAGALSDRRDPVRMIEWGLVIGAGSLVSMPFIVDGLAGSSWFVSQSLTVQILLASLLVCLTPGIALSFVTPPSIRSLTRRADEVGAVSGRVFAWGTFGSLFGNYLAGFVLLALFGVRWIIAMTSVVLLLLTVVTMIVGRRHARLNATVSAGQHEARGEKHVQVTEGVRDNMYWLSILTVTLCSFVSGAVEGAAFRIFAPIVGVSMFLSAGVIGVVLAGMSLGNAIGGRMASHHGTTLMLGRSLLACSLTTLAIAPLWQFATTLDGLRDLPLIPQIVVWSFGLFFLPALALGTITPQVIRLSVREVRESGSIAGQLYAWSTLGCIAGIMGSAWFMIEAFGAVRTTIICGAVPACLAWLQSQTPQSRTAVQGGGISSVRCGLAVAASAILIAACPSPFDRESKYFSIKVTDAVIDGRKVKELTLDRLVHSVADLNDPGFLYYKHEQVQADFTEAASRDARRLNRQPRILVIGGGGYTFPRWVEAQPHLSDVRVDVVEIDPVVTDVAYSELGVPHSPRIVSYNVDGRQFVKTAPESCYDLVIQDAVNDLSVPYHLMTAEYNRLIRRLLRPDGVYLLTVIDALESGRFLASAVRTVDHAFAETRVFVPAEQAAMKTRMVMVIAARFDERESNDVADNDWWKRRTKSYQVPQQDIEALLLRHGDRSPLLTDDFAPVDILLSSEVLKSEA